MMIPLQQWTSHAPSDRSVWARVLTLNDGCLNFPCLAPPGLTLLSPPFPPPLSVSCSGRTVACQLLPLVGSHVGRSLVRILSVTTPCGVQRCIFALASHLRHHHKEQFISPLQAPREEWSQGSPFGSAVAATTVCTQAQLIGSAFSRDARLSFLGWSCLFRKGLEGEDTSHFYCEDTSHVYCVCVRWLTWCLDLSLCWYLFKATQKKAQLYKQKKIG